MLQEKNSIQNLYLAKLYFKRKGEINTLRQTKNEGILANIPALQEMLQVLQEEGKLYGSETWISIKKRRALEKK